MELATTIDDYQKLRTASNAKFKEIREDPKKGHHVVPISTRILENYHKIVQTISTADR